MLAEFVYCYLLRPWPLRPLANWAIRQLLPVQVNFGEAVVVLNPDGPVVSGALHFGVYEKAETKFFQSACRKGMTFLDVGANVGYYTALAARAVGPTGKIIALEPDPESFKCLEQTIAANGTENVQAFPVAASDAPATLPLYISADNRGDNRLYAPGESRPQVEVKAVATDALLAENKINTVDTDIPQIILTTKGCTTCACKLVSNNKGMVPAMVVAEVINIALNRSFDAITALVWVSMPST